MFLQIGGQQLLATFVIRVLIPHYKGIICLPYELQFA